VVNYSPKVVMAFVLNMQLSRV